MSEIKPPKPAVDPAPATPTIPSKYPPPPPPPPPNEYGDSALPTSDRAPRYGIMLNGVFGQYRYEFTQCLPSGEVRVETGYSNHDLDDNQGVKIIGGFPFFICGAFVRVRVDHLLSYKKTFCPLDINTAKEVQ
jgi:hypothetical protein